LIEAFIGQTISEFFEKYGEEAFRKIERDILMSLLTDRDTIIATGGGTACYEDNMDLMNRGGITVFLDTPVELIITRLKDETRYRPLLRNIQPGELPVFIRDHLEGRRKYYNKAAIRIEKEDIGAVVDAVRSFGR
ncbi:MAG: shikimate kinase, partial [Bacteroidales bacterium]|nr:shikimate kinase [Bacteroidales bacterium]